MMSRFALWLPMALLAMLALLTFWIDQSVKEAGSRNGINLGEPDSIVENFLAESTDAAGVPRYRLSAEKLSHFSGDRQTLLDNPKLTHFHESQGEMQISSSKASITADGGTVVFTDQVNLHRPAGEGRNEMSMQTSYLEILTEKNEAFTEQPVVIQQPGMHITAAGLHLFADTRVLKLKGRVKAQYQNANRA
jgi:lipopolysaccharide export system protein LptC